MLAFLLLAAAQPPTDPDVVPAQFTQPPAATAPPPRMTPPATPAPAVQLVVLVPQDSPPGHDLTYTLRATNTGSADAHKVIVRMPTPDGATIVKSEPKSDDPKELLWRLKTLKPGATDEIKVTVKPNNGVRDVTARAYVSLEHGQQVVTRVNGPKLKLKAESVKSAVLGDPVPVRVTVANDGRVPVQTVKLTATASAGFEFDPNTSGEKTKDANQRVWEVGTIPPGVVRTLDLRMTAKAAGELKMTVAADGAGQVQAAETVAVTVRELKLKVDFRGDPTAAADQGAGYDLIVSNTGTQPLTNVRVTALIPEGCRVRRQTDGGRRDRGTITWEIPRMPVGDTKYSYRFWLAAEEPGRKTVRVAAVTRGAEDTASVTTAFAGSANLHWETVFDHALVSVDKSGMYTVKVMNNGTELARGVSLTVVVPKEVSLVKATPTHKEPTPGQLVFDPQDIPAGREVTYSVTFRGESVGQAMFVAELSDGSPGVKPTRTDKSVQITGRR